jgi:hypothetical protein
MGKDGAGVSGKARSDLTAEFVWQSGRHSSKMGGIWRSRGGGDRKSGIAMLATKMLSLPTALLFRATHPCHVSEIVTPGYATSPPNAARTLAADGPIPSVPAAHLEWSGTILSGIPPARLLYGSVIATGLTQSVQQNPLIQFIDPAPFKSSR